MVFLPECFDYIGRTVAEQIDNAMDENGCDQKIIFLWISHF